MKITLHNIGKIGEATIELNGITVIAGENNTGKSTVGKALYSVFNSLYKINEQIDRERGYSIERIFGVFSNTLFDDTDGNKLRIKKFIENSKNNLQNSEWLQKEIENMFTEWDQIPEKKINKKELKEAIKRITKILHISDDEIFKAIVLEKLNSEFNGQINNIYAPDTKGQIELTIKDNPFTISVLHNEITNMSNNLNLNLNTEVIYIDDPFILDEGNPSFWRYEDVPNHRDYLKRKLFSSKTESNVIDGIIAKDKLKNILFKINTVCSGEMVKTSPNRFGYKKNTGDPSLNIENLSTGLKTFVILKTLLLKGVLEENGTIVLDEPEIHLHPKWQLLFAELIVLIQKEFGMHILINTHSPYFLNAIEVYAEKHKILEKCKFYLAENTEETSNIVDVTREIDKIYAKLAKPLQDLENIRYSDD